MLAVLLHVLPSLAAPAKPDNCVDATPLISSFGAGPGANRRTPELMVRGAAAIMPALKSMVHTIDPSWPENWRSHHCMMSMQEFVASRKQLGYAKSVKHDGEMTLPRVFRSYSAGKSAGLVYSQIVDELGGRHAPLRLLEIGIGSNKTGAPNGMATWQASSLSYETGKREVGKKPTKGTSRPYIPGASLRAWRDYLSRASVFGADVEPDILFTEERIQTHIVDQLSPTSFATLHRDFGGAKYDMFIDDGLHAFATNLNSLEFALRSVKRGGWIIIEDISPALMQNLRVIDWMLKRHTDVAETCFVEQMGRQPKVETPIAFLYTIHLRA